MFLFWKYKKEELNTIILTLFSYNILYSLGKSFLNAKEDKHYDIFSYYDSVGINVYFVSQTLGILFYYIFKDKNTKFNPYSAIFGLAIGAVNSFYHIFLFDFPQPCKGITFIAGIVIYLLLYKPKLNNGKICLSLFLIIIFTVIDCFIHFKKDNELYLNFHKLNLGKSLIDKYKNFYIKFYSKRITFIFLSCFYSIFLAAQFMGEKFLIEKEKTNMYLLMGFEGFGGFAFSLIYYLFKERHIYDLIDQDNSYLIFFFMVIYFCYNLNRFYLSKYTNLCQNIFVFELAKFFFYYVTLVGVDYNHDIEYLFCSIPIFLGMAIFNEMIGLSVFVEDDNDNNNNNNNFKTSLIDQSSNNNINNNNVLNNNINNDINTNNYNAPNVNSMPNVNDAPNFNNNNNIIVDNSNNNMQETDRTEN